MQPAGTQKWLRCVPLPLGCGEKSTPAWSQDGGQREYHKVKIEADGARICPAQIKDGQGLSTQQRAVGMDGGLLTSQRGHMQLSVYFAVGHRGQSK